MSDKVPWYEAIQKMEQFVDSITHRVDDAFWTDDDPLVIDCYKKAIQRLTSIGYSGIFADIEYNMATHCMCIELNQIKNIFGGFPIVINFQRTKIKFYSIEDKLLYDITTKLEN